MSKKILSTPPGNHPRASILSQSEADVNVKFARKEGRSTKGGVQIARHERRKAQPKPKQLTVWQSQQKPEIAPYLQIASIPVDERINHFEHRYCLVILPYGVRACGGQFTANEVHQVAQATKRWDWSLDEAGRLRCLPALEVLLDSICKRSYRKGGECNA